MSNLSLRLYHGLPAPARSLAATLRGLYLQWWRYGPDSERLVLAARERAGWTLAEWAAWRDERLGYVLHRAATRVPYYRQRWEARRRRGDRASPEYLENWPVLEKDPLRLNPRAFVADDCRPWRMSHEQTSGTSGKPLHLWRSRLTVETLYALSITRTREWHGVSRNDRWAMLGGQLVVAAARRRPPFWVWNAALRQLYMSSYHLAPDLIPHYLDALVRHRIAYLFGYTSSLFALAQEALRLGRTDLRMRVAITSAEPVSERERETIAAAFHCPVRETYGMGELVAAASECEAGTLHEWPEIGWIEVRDEADEPVAPGASGELICTGLLNADMPLIRYRVGDSARLRPAAHACVCGRGLPAFAGIDGRTNDILLTRDGRRVAWLNPVLYGVPVRQAQIVQETLDRVRVRYVPAPEFLPATGRLIAERLRERLGDVAVVLEAADEIPRSANGKLRSVVCAIPSEEREALLATLGTGRTGGVP